MATQKSEARIVILNDGRSVSFGKRMKMVKEILRDSDMLPEFVRFSFANGESRKIRLADIPEATLEELTAHGAKQKIGDECSDLDNVEDYVVAVEDMIDRLCDGVWKEEREGGFAGSAILIAACMEVFNKTRDETRDILKTMKPNERAALATQDPAVKAAVERLNAAKVEGMDVVAIAAKFAAKPDVEAPKEE